MSYHLRIKQGNLVEEPNATFIVDASNTRLILGSGVSMAFKRHCGTELQSEMTQVLESIGKPLQKGDVVLTSSANAKNFLYALHVAVMNYNPGVRGNDKNPSVQTIETALKNVERYLQWYWEKYTKKMKLVLPLMGCGVGGLDKLEVIRTYKDFFSRDVSFECEVIVYGYSSADFELLKRIIY